MAQISLDLSQFASSGIYTIEYDQSQQFLVNPQTVRLVVGFSKQGPFNAPVFCPDIKTARQVFGDIDPILERKGSFFHRSLFTCLQTGPVFALNLLALNDDDTYGLADKVNYRAFSIDTSEFNGTLHPLRLSSYYNKERFWKADPEYFLSSVDFSFSADSSKLFDVTNIGKTPTSVIIKKSLVKGYDITANEWYTTVDLPQPEWLNDDDYISDFFIDVIAIQGDWTNFAQLATDPIYSTYFDTRGFKYNPNAPVDLLKQFLSLTEVTAVASITGCLIPDFADKNGIPQFIETLVNNTSAVTGLFCTVNKVAFDDLADNNSHVDLVGHSMISALQTGQTSWDFLSYRAPLVADQLFVDGSTTYAVYDSPYNTYVATEGSDLYNAVITDNVVDGDVIITDNIGTKQYLKIFNFVDNFGYPYVEIRAYVDPAFGTQENIAAIGSMYTYEGAMVSAGQINIVSLYGKYNTYYNTVTPDPSVTLGSSEFLLTQSDASAISPGDLFVASNTAPNWQSLTTYATSALVSYGGIIYESLVGSNMGNQPDISPSFWKTAGGDRLTRVTKKATIQNGIYLDVKVTCSAAVNIYSGNRVQNFQKIVNFVQELNVTYLAGFALTATHLPDGSDARMNEILDVLYSTNIATALADKNIITWRYLVDTFQGGLEENCKWRLAQVAMMRKQAMALLNVPSAQMFINSTDPVFTDALTAANPKPLLDTAYIVAGGNQSLNPSFNFTLVDESLGSKNAGYFFPNITLVQNGKNISVPPAAHVSNQFIQKFISGTPFAIVAGTRRGLISDPNLVGPEISLFDSDRDNLEPFGINPIIKMRGQGTLIYANQTGYQRINSAMNNLHVRDILITIEEGIEQILMNYVFEFNDASTRLEIVSKVENYLDTVQSAGALYDFDVIMNSTNNTPDVIDQNVGIIDVVVEPARGLQKIINRVTVTRTGAIASGGFTLA